MAEGQIVAIGGGGLCPGLCDFVAGLTGRERPRLLYIGTAGAEDPAWALRVYDAFGDRATISRLEFFPWPPDDLRDFVLGHDAVFVGGGNSANMLAIWRLHEVDEILREAYEQGIVLSGSSAGGLIWFEAGVTDSFGPQYAPYEYLGFLPGSFSPHFDDEAERRPVYHRLVADGFPAGYAADASVGLHFVGKELREAVACNEGTGAYRVELVDGEIVETPIAARLLA